MTLTNTKLCLSRLKSEDIQIRFKGITTYEDEPEFRNTLFPQGFVKRLDWHGEPISSNQY